MSLPPSSWHPQGRFFREKPESELESTTDDEHDKSSNEYPTNISNEHAPKSMDEGCMAISTKKKLNLNKRGRRGRKREYVSKNSSNKFSIFLSNIRGARSKMLSLQAIVKNPTVDPEVISLVETNLKKTS